MTDTIERLRKIKRFDQLVAYLRDDLDWPIESDDFEQVTYDWEADELGIDPKHAAKIQEIKQLRPLASNQQWGIFFVKFEPKQLPVVVMRRLLNKLVIKKRATVKSANQASWRMHDLLFVSEYGLGNERKISFAHFTEGDSANMPTLKVLDWDADDTGHKLQFVSTQLSNCLRWPKNTEDQKAWRAQWSSAFTVKHRHVINTAKDLAEQLATLCRSICDEANRILDIENDKGTFRRLYESFRTALIHDLTESDFADMFAQTITYGLFSTAVSGTVNDGERSSTYVDTQRMVDLVPITNPFLKEMLSEFPKSWRSEEQNRF